LCSTIFGRYVVMLRAVWRLCSTIFGRYVVMLRAVRRLCSTIFGRYVVMLRAVFTVDTVKKKPLVCCEAVWSGKHVSTFRKSLLPP
jgi:hypothetical protein